MNESAYASAPRREQQTWLMHKRRAVGMWLAAAIPLSSLLWDFSWFALAVAVCLVLGGLATFKDPDQAGDVLVWLGFVIVLVLAFWRFVEPTYELLASMALLLPAGALLLFGKSVAARR